MADASIVLKINDQTSAGFSSVRRSAGDAAREFDSLGRKISALQEKNKALNHSYAQLQAELVDAKKAVQEATAAYKQSADEANRTKLTRAQEEYKALTDRMQDFKTASSDTRKEIRELQNEMRKTESGGGSSRSGGGALTGWGAAMSALGKQFSGAASGYLGHLMQSGLGSTGATMAQSMISGMLSGGSAGLLTGNPIGVAAGAAIGAASGLIEGFTAKSEQEDEVFKSYRDDLVSGIAERIESSRAGGSATAAQREKDRLAFSSLIGADRADLLLGNLQALANVTPYVYDDLTGIARQLSIYSSTNDQIFDKLKIIGDTGAALGKSTSEMAGLASLLGKIGSSELYRAEFTESLRSNSINPTELLAEAYGISEAEAMAMMTGGELSGIDAMRAIFSALGTRYGGMMQQQATTYAGALSTNEGLLAERDAAMGAAYNAARKSGLETQNAWLQQGDMAKAFSMIGTALAQKENYEEAIARAVTDGIFGDNHLDLSVLDEQTSSEVLRLREEYSQLMAEYDQADAARQMEIGAKIYEIYGQAEILASAAADASGEMEAWHEASLALVDQGGQIIGRLDSFRYLMNQQISATRGLAYARDQGSTVPTASVGVSVPQRYAGYLSGQADRAAPESTRYWGNPIPKRAVGQHVIPYDGYLISAHEGEMLLTAQEARQYQSGGARAVVTGNTFIVRQESDIDAIADALARKLRSAAQIIA